MEALSNPLILVGGIALVLIIVMFIMFLVEKKRKREVDQLDNMFPEGHLSGEQLEKIPVEKVRRSTMERMKRSQQIADNFGKRTRPGKNEQQIEGDDQEFIQTSTSRSFQSTKSRLGSTLSKQNKQQVYNEENVNTSKGPTLFSQKKGKSQSRIQAKKELMNTNPNTFGENTSETSQDKEQQSDSAINRFRDRLKPSKVAKDEAQAALEASKGASVDTINSKNESVARRKYKKDILKSEEEATESASKPKRFQSRSNLSTSTDAVGDNNSQSKEENTLSQSTMSNRSSRKRINSTGKHQQSSTNSSGRKSTVKRKKLF